MRMREKGEVTHETAFLYILSPLRISVNPTPTPHLSPPVNFILPRWCAFRARMRFLLERTPYSRDVVVGPDAYRCWFPHPQWERCWKQPDWC